MMNWMFGNYGMGYGPGMGLFMLFFWFLIILGIIILLKGLLGAGRKEEQRDEARESAEEILKKRYARGEIDEEEFRRIRENLH